MTDVIERAFLVWIIAGWVPLYVTVGTGTGFWVWFLGALVLFASWRTLHRGGNQ